MIVIPFLDIIDFVIAIIGQQRSSSTSNEYFDVMIKTSEHDSKQVKVMVLKDNAELSRKSFVDKKNAVLPIKIRHASVSPSGTIFLNKATSIETAFLHEVSFKYNEMQVNDCMSIIDILGCSDGTFSVKGKLVWKGKIRSPQKCKQSVRDAILCDSTGTIPISIWEEHHGKIIDGQFYSLSNVKLRHFNDKQLSTLPFTEIAEIESFGVGHSEINN